VSCLVLVVQDDLAAVAPGRRIVLLEDLQTVLGLYAGQREVVRIVAPEGPVEDLERGQRDEPGDDDDHEVPGTPLPQPPQHPLGSRPAVPCVGFRGRHGLGLFRRVTFPTSPLDAYGITPASRAYWPLGRWILWRGSAHVPQEPGVVSVGQGDISAMLWNGVSRMPRLAGRGAGSPPAPGRPAADSVPVRGAGEAKRYSLRAPSGSPTRAARGRRCLAARRRRSGRPASIMPGERLVGEDVFERGRVAAIESALPARVPPTPPMSTRSRSARPSNRSASSADRPYAPAGMPPPIALPMVSTSGSGPRRRSQPPGPGGERVGLVVDQVRAVFRRVSSRTPAR
jgi:hypothetical protein